MRLWGCVNLEDYWGTIGASGTEGRIELFCPLHRKRFKQSCETRCCIAPFHNRLHNLRRQQCEPQYPRQIRRCDLLVIRQITDGGEGPGREPCPMSGGR